MVRKDPISKAFRRLEAAGREAAIPPTGERPNFVSLALWVFALALIGLAIFALFEGWLLPVG
jgi:uncharacterized protein YbjT (DUF2867 family)